MNFNQFKTMTMKITKCGNKLTCFTVRNDILGGRTKTCYALHQSFHGLTLRIHWAEFQYEPNTVLLYPQEPGNCCYWIKSLLDCLKIFWNLFFLLMNLPWICPSVEINEHILKSVSFSKFMILWTTTKGSNNQMKKLRSSLQCICIKICCMLLSDPRT